MTSKQKNYENLGDSLIEKFNLRQIEAYYAKDGDEALEKACRFLTPNAVSPGRFPDTGGNRIN